MTLYGDYTATGTSAMFHKYMYVMTSLSRYDDQALINRLRVCKQAETRQMITLPC